VQSQCNAVLMGRTTFEPALSAPHWPWGDLDVFVLGSHRCGPRTIETYRALGALDEFRLLVLPMLAGDGRRVTPDVDCELIYAAQPGAANPRT